MIGQILLFARYPLAGPVKTRLTPPLSSEEARALYEAFLEDSIRSVASLASEITTTLMVANPDDIGPMHRWLARRNLSVNDVKGQQGDDLGARLYHAIRTVQEDTTALLLGTDHPTLPVDYLRTAFRRAERADVVLGPAEDGGYYALATKRRDPEIFERLPYSTPGLMEALQTRLRELDLRPVFLPEWYDVDGIADLRKLAEDPRLALAPRTQHVLGSLEHLLT